MKVIAFCEALICTDEKLTKGILHTGNVSLRFEKRGLSLAITRADARFRMEPNKL